MSASLAFVQGAPSPAGMALRSDFAAEAVHGPSSTSRSNASCLECGASYSVGSQASDFCSDRCRMSWNRRRSSRGAELYDLFMALRYDRETATTLKVWRLINRLAAIFRDEDRRERAGRMSWRPPAAILERRPYLRADILIGRRGEPS